MAPHTFSTRDYKQLQPIPDVHTLQFTVTHALGFSVLTSRILSSRTCYHMMRPGRRLTTSPTNNKHKLSIVNCLLYTVLYTSHIHMTILTEEALKQKTALSFVIYNTLLPFMQHVNSRQFVATVTRNCLLSDLSSHIYIYIYMPVKNFPVTTKRKVSLWVYI
jgi:hypothetical protein